MQNILLSESDENPFDNIHDLETKQSSDVFKSTMLHENNDIVTIGLKRRI